MRKTSVCNYLWAISERKLFLKKLQKSIKTEIDFFIFYLICHNVQIHRFVVSGDYPREIKWAINQSIRLIVLTTERKNRSTNYDKVVDLLTRDFHPERKKKSVLKCSNQNFFFPNHLFCSLLTLSSSASSPQLLCFSLSLSLPISLPFIFHSLSLWFTPALIGS